jgi:hypothetical protein
MKRYSVTATFPQALAKHHTQCLTVTATSWPLAAKRALAEALKRPGIKGLRHTAMQLTLVVVKESEELS